MQLSKQSIRRLCLMEKPMITPFMPSKVVINGKSAGLSSASYDCRIDHDLVLGVNPALIIAKYHFDNFDKRRNFLLSQLAPIAGGDRIDPVTILELIKRLYDDDVELAQLLYANPPHTALAYTVEDFCIPHNVSGGVCDKSSYARVFVSAFNTFFDPGFEGNATLELVNLGDAPVTYRRGDPVAQMIFHWLDEPTEEPYNGKYMHQTKQAHAARFEDEDDGKTIEDCKARFIPQFTRLTDEAKAHLTRPENPDGKI